MTDKDLTDKIKKGDQQAFKELVLQYQSMVVNTCYGFLHNKEDAEDVAQNVFIDVFQKIDQFRGDAKLSTWLYRIAANHSINYLRSNKKNRVVISIDKENTSASPIINQMTDNESNHPDKKIEAEERKKVLHKAIDELPENQKTAFTLSKFRDLSYKEIAEVMDTSVSAVESILFRAKQNLQKKLVATYKQINT